MPRGHHEKNERARRWVRCDVGGLGPSRGESGPGRLQITACYATMKGNPPSCLGRRIPQVKGRASLARQSRRRETESDRSPQLVGGGAAFPQARVQGRRRSGPRGARAIKPGDGAGCGHGISLWDGLELKDYREMVKKWLTVHVQCDRTIQLAFPSDCKFSLQQRRRRNRRIR